MQHFPLTLFTLAGLLVSLLLLRKRWGALGRRTRQLLLASALLSIVLFVGGYGSKWVTASDRLNCAVYWAALAGYLLLLAVHSLNRPRWLTSLTAIILGLPIFASSIFLPLNGLFYPAPRQTRQLDDHLSVSLQPFTETGTSSTGADIDVFSRPRHFPFLRHTHLGGRFYDSRCNTAATEVLLQPDHNSVFVLCPSWPDAAEPDRGAVIRLHP